MKEILLNNGFADNGACKICTVPARKYSKVVNGHYYVVKLFVRNTKQGVIEAGYGNLYLPNSKRLPVNINTIDDVLATHGLK